MSVTVAIDRLLTRRRIVRIAITIAAVALITLVLSFAFSKGGRTPVGTVVAADYPQFYVAGKILSDPGPAKLYDLQLQSRMQLKMFPGETRGLPYAYPPVVAYVLRPLTHFSYTGAAAIYVCLAAVFYLIGLFALWNVCSEIETSGRWLAVWVCLAFEPFAFECLHGGQVSTFAFTCVCMAIWMDKRDRAVLSGVFLGLLAYKPPLLAMLLPAMALGRRWKMFSGCAGVIALGALLSLCCAGPVACREFVRMIGTYGNAVAGNDGFRTTKYVDLSAFLRLLRLPREISFFAPVVGLIGAWGFLAWLQQREDEWPAREIVWAAALAGTLVLNLYVAIYDTVLIVPALWLGADLCYRRWGKLTRGFRVLLATIFIAPWISSWIAMAIGLQIDTLVLAGAVVWICVSFWPTERVRSTDLALTSADPSPLR